MASERVNDNNNSLNIVNDKSPATGEQGFNSSYITDDLFKAILKDIDPQGTLAHWRPSNLDTQNSILAHMAADDEDIKCFVGHIAYKISYTLPGDDKDTYRHKHVVLKAKPRGDATTTSLYHVAAAIGGKYAEIWESFQDKIGFSNTDHREIEALRLTDRSVKSIRPRTFYTMMDESKSIFVYVMEHFVKEKFTHMDSVDHIDIWTSQDIEDVLSNVAEMHARYYGRVSDLPPEFVKWLDVPSKEKMLEKLPLWKVALQHNNESFKEIWNDDITKMMENALLHLDKIGDVLESSPKTLVHNDFNVRNICFRPNPTGLKKRLCLYDWELVTLAPPQHDIAEFLSFVLPPTTGITTWQSYVMKYRTFFIEELSKLNNTVPGQPAIEFERAVEPDFFMKVFDMSVLELLINRFALYGLPHTFHPYSFMDRVVKSAAGYVNKICHKYDFLSMCND